MKFFLKYNLICSFVIFFISFIFFELFFCDLSKGTCVVIFIKNTFYSIFASFIFYFFVVNIPEIKTKKRIKSNAQRAYRNFKEDMILSFLQLANLEQENRDDYLDVKKFKEKFKDDVWYKIANGIYENPHYLKDWKINATILKDELTYLMMKLESERENSVRGLRIFQADLIRLNNADLEYDEVKSIMRSFWEIFAGWNFIKGYQEDDIIEKNIESF